MCTHCLLGACGLEGAVGWDDALSAGDPAIVISTSRTARKITKQPTSPQREHRLLNSTTLQENRLKVPSTISTSSSPSVFSGTTTFTSSTSHPVTFIFVPFSRLHLLLFQRQLERKKSVKCKSVLWHASANANALGMWTSARDKAEKTKQVCTSATVSSLCTDQHSPSA